MTQTVLLLESEPLARAALAEYLRDCGYRVIEAVTSDEAAAYLEREEKFAAALLDVTAKGTPSVFELAALIRRFDASIEIILAGTIEAAAQRAGDLCDDGPALARPYDPSQVLDRIRRRRARPGRADHAKEA